MIKPINMFLLIKRTSAVYRSFVALLLFSLPIVSVKSFAAAPSVQGISSGGLPSGPGGSSPTNGPMKASAIPSASAFFEKYMIFDVKHFTTDFYDELGRRVKRDASVRSSVRGGFKLLGGIVDGSLGAGAAKLTSEPRIFHNRSDALLQVYPARGPIFDLLVYVNAMFPVRIQDLDPTEYMEGGRYDDDMRRAIDATIVFTGVAPKMKIDIPTAAGRFSHFVTLDARMMTYSKSLTGEDSGGTTQSSSSSDSNSSESIPPLIDWAPRYAHQILTGLAYSPSFLNGFELEFAGSFESRFIPDYFYNKCSKSWNYTYDVDRVSFTRFKLSATLNKDLSFQAESYFIRNGFFKVDRVNDQSRFKNIFSLVLKI